MTQDDDVPFDPDLDRFERDGRRPPCQLYLISPPEIGPDFVDQLRAALDSGAVAAFQLRLKGVDEEEIARLAPPLQALCAEREVAFIINDSIALAQRLNADGVHLGQGDGDPKDARRILGPAVQIGVTCHDSRHLAMEAGEAGADYVAFGAFYPTQTKETTHEAAPALLRWWSTLMELPCVAIGGITPDNARPLVDAGADFIAVSGAVWNHPDGPGAGVAAFASVLG
ncbi:MAG: thiamine phosphate synthase [Sphingomonas sp.]|nr:thiamine phosphate synthase [Sphingomonas sp.]